MDDFLMDDFLKSITIDQLDGDSLDLAEVIGMDAFLKLVAVYGGSNCLYVPRLLTLRTNARNQEMRKEYEAGATPKALARKYHLTERYVRDVVRNSQKGRR